MNRFSNVANGHVEVRQVANQQLSPANLLSGGGLPNNTNAAGTAITRTRNCLFFICSLSITVSLTKHCLYRRHRRESEPNDDCCKKVGREGKSVYALC
jgi:hypothetical protein